MALNHREQVIVDARANALAPGDTESARCLITEAAGICGSYVELARRTGYSRNYLYRCRVGSDAMGYPLQVMCRAIIAEKGTD